MAIGLGRMFGIVLPINFASPYRSTSIIDFWRTWHITLSRFLRDYVYFPLGGGRQGWSRRYANLLATMAIGGIWHGAGWTFLMWGVLHGAALALNHLWRLTPFARWTARIVWPCRVLTFATVVVLWVPFRAADVGTTVRFWEGMIGSNGLVVPTSAAALPLIATIVDRLDFTVAQIPSITTPLFAQMIACWLIAWFLPATQTWMRAARIGLATQGYAATQTPSEPTMWWTWRPSLAFAIVTGLLITAVAARFSNPSEFIYFQF